MIELLGATTTTVFPRSLPASTVSMSSATRDVQAPATPADADSIELGSSLRVAKLQAIRDEILAGNYETPERIEGTVSRLLDIIA